MKFCVQILLYNVTPYILKALENCGPFVEKIYVAYSPLPYSDYNQAARGTFQNKTDPGLLRQSPYWDKIVLIQNNWANETDQRNECLAAARRDGMDVMIVQDADEFYHPEGYARNLQSIESHPDYDYYLVQWYIFWKTTDYVIMHRDGSLLEPCACFAVNCRRPVDFRQRRATTGQSNFTLPGLCYHLAYVHSNESMLEKINTWSHAAEVNREDWYLAKWKLWRPATRRLGPVCPCGWRKAVRFTDGLPGVLADFQNPPVNFVRPTLGERLRCWRFDAITVSRDFARIMKSRCLAVFRKDRAHL